jgi:hypothetical protein
MGQCSRCGRQAADEFPQCLAIPELRAMVNHWPWHRVPVCPECRAAFDRDFRTRLKLLAADAVAQQGDVTEPVCLLCGNQDATADLAPSARWVNASGAPAATRFSVCRECRGKVLVGRVVSAAELRSAGDFRTALTAISQMADSLVQRAEGWSLSDGPGPKGSAAVERNLSIEAAADRAFAFWSTMPDAIRTTGGNVQRGATLKPDKPGAIRLYLELQWRGGEPSAPSTATLRVYRAAPGYLIVRMA